MPPSSMGRWPGYAAAIWALLFAVLHVVWAAGWYIGLDHETARRAFDQTWKLVYDIVVAGMCGLAVLVALALVGTWGRQVPRRLVRVLAWSGTGLLVLRGGGGVMEGMFLAAVGKFVWEPMMLWEIWFCVGAALFLHPTWRFGRA